jgi:protein-S-isoprenylcysteine O-methyltransferase Ste14
MYVGFTAAYLGLAGLINAAWPIILLPAVLVVLTVFVIEREERHLSDAFGAAYDDYRARVRRWL